MGYSGVIKSQVSFHIDEMIHKTTQPTEDLILDRNRELRKNEGVIQDLGAQEEGGTWGRQVASIPLIKLQEAVKDGFDIYNKDQSIASKELFRFLQSEKGKPCMIREKL